MMQHSTLAERIVFGRPVDPVLDEDVVHITPRPATALIGRILICAIFLISGIMKLVNTPDTVGYMNAAGIPAADTLVYVAAIAEIAGGLSILFGFLTRIGALGLIVLLAIINLTMHPFWSLEGQERSMQMSQFIKNLGLMGGLAFLVAFGPGRYSIDRKIRAPLEA